MSCMSAAARRCLAFVQAGGPASYALRFMDVDWHVGRLLTSGVCEDALARCARHPAHVVDNGASTAGAATPAGAPAALNRHGQAAAVYGRELAAGAPASVSASSSSRLLSAGAPAKSVAVLLAAASARPHHVAPHVDLGAVAAAAGAPAHTVAALDVAALAAAAYGREFAPVAWALAEELGALATVAVAMAEDVDALSVAAAPPAHAAAPIDLGVLAAAFYRREIRAGAPASVRACEVTAAAGARLLPAGAPTRTVARLLAAASSQPNPVVPAVDVGALAAAAGAPAHAVAGLDMAILAAAAYGPDFAIGAGASRSRVTTNGTILTGGGLSSARGFGFRMLCTATGGGGGNEATQAPAATKSELNNLRAEVVQYFLKASKETNKLWEEINALRVKTVETASRIVLSIYGLIGSVLMFVIPYVYVKGAWQADTVQAVSDHQNKVDSERDKIIEALSASVITLTKLVEGMSARQERSHAEITRVLEAVKQNGEKTEALAAAMAATEKSQHEEREKDLARPKKTMAEREKRDEEKRKSHWF